jgi:transcriptional regulator with XRE-family HTH domain
MARKKRGKPPEPVAKEMAKRIRDQRKAREWTQLDLAKATGWVESDADDGASSGYSPSRIGNYEQGTRRLGIEEAELFGRTFDLPAAYFLTVIDEHEARVIQAMRRKQPEHRRKAG